MINNFFRSWLLNKKFTFSVKPWRVFNSWSCSRPRAESEKILGFFNHGFWNRSTNTCPILQHNKTRSANYKELIPFISLNKYTCKPPLRNQNPQLERSFSFPSQRLQQRGKQLIMQTWATDNIWKNKTNYFFLPQIMSREHLVING